MKQKVVRMKTFEGKLVQNVSFVNFLGESVLHLAGTVLKVCRQRDIGTVSFDSNLAEATVADDCSTYIAFHESGNFTLEPEEFASVTGHRGACQ